MPCRTWNAADRCSGAEFGIASQQRVDVQCLPCSGWTSLPIWCSPHNMELRALWLIISQLPPHQILRSQYRFLQSAAQLPAAIFPLFLYGTTWETERKLLLGAIHCCSSAPTPLHRDHLPGNSSRQEGKRWTLFAGAEQHSFVAPQRDIKMWL